MNDCAFRGETRLVAGAFEEPFFLMIIDLAAKMGAFSRYGPGALPAVEEDEVRPQEKSARGKGGLDLNYAWLGWHLVAKKAQDRITEGKQANDQKKTSPVLWWLRVRGCCRRHDP